MRVKRWFGVTIHWQAQLIVVFCNSNLRWTAKVNRTGPAGPGDQRVFTQNPASMRGALLLSKGPEAQGQPIFLAVTLDRHLNDRTLATHLLQVTKHHFCQLGNQKTDRQPAAQQRR